MKHFRYAVTVAVALTVSGIAQTRPAPIVVFVTSVGAVNGFTDPSKDNQDTVKDLRDALKAYKALAQTDQRDDAPIVLVVMGRERTRPLDCTVRVKFLYKDLETELSASSMPLIAASCGEGWGRSAGKVAKQVNDWVAANRAKLN